MRVLLKDHDDNTLTEIEANYLSYDSDESCLWLSLQDENENTELKVSGNGRVTIPASTGNSLIQEAFRTGAIDLSSFCWDWTEE